MTVSVGAQDAFGPAAVFARDAATVIAVARSLAVAAFAAALGRARSPWPTARRLLGGPQRLLAKLGRLLVRLLGRGYGSGLRPQPGGGSSHGGGLGPRAGRRRGRRGRSRPGGGGILRGQGGPRFGEGNVDRLGLAGRQPLCGGRRFRQGRLPDALPGGGARLGRGAGRLLGCLGRLLGCL